MILQIFPLDCRFVPCKVPFWEVTFVVLSNPAWEFSQWAEVSPSKAGMDMAIFEAKNLGSLRKVLPSLKLTAISPLKIGRAPKRKIHLNQPLVFRGYSLVSGSVLNNFDDLILYLRWAALALGNQKTSREFRSNLTWHFFKGETYEKKLMDPQKCPKLFDTEKGLWMV